MEDNSKLLEKLRGMDDAELEAAIHTVARAMGVNEKIAGKFAADRSKIRRKLDSASEDDLARVMSMLTPAQLAGIRKSLGI